MAWMNTATGEVVNHDDPCHRCAQVLEDCTIQVAAMERERRADRSARARADAALAAIDKPDDRTRRDEIWREVLAAWKTAFPDERTVARGIRSANATSVFSRIQSGADIEDLKDAIAGAWEFPYVVYGKRVTNGSRTDKATDIQAIMSVKNDANFDFLCAEGRKLRGRADV